MPAGRKYCSLKCYRSTPARPQRKTGDTRPCLQCGEASYKAKAIQRGKWFCSTNCHDKHQGRGKIKFNCKTCANPFRLSASVVEQRQYAPKFCSIDCRNRDPEWKRGALNGNLAQMNKKGFNKLEVAGYAILTALGLKFEPQAVIDGRFCVDALIGNVVIQWDGEYWHGHPSKIKGKPDKRQAMRMRLDKSQDAYMKKHGYKVLRFWGNEVLNNQGEVDEVIRRAVRGIA